MSDSINMTCEDIKKKLKLFLDDLLVEDEHKAFCGHIDTCGKCRNYVRSIGALCNQIWKLGKVKIPEAFCFTALFKFRQAGQGVQKSKFVISKKLAVGIATLTLIVPLFFLGIRYWISRKYSKEADQTPAVEVYVQGKRALSEHEAEYLPEGFKGTAATSGEPIEEKALGPGIDREAPSVEKDTKRAPPAEKGPVHSAPKPLHWHFQYSEDTEKGKLLDALRALGIRTEDLAPELVGFTAQGEKAESALEQALFISRGHTSLKDFTIGIPVYPKSEYRVSIYFEKQDTDALHWHISYTLPHQKARLLEIIQDKGGSIEYVSDALVVFSVNRNELELLKTRIQAMKVFLSEFGQLRQKEGVFISGPVKISIYFS